MAPKGFIIHRGLSPETGDPIVGILTLSSGNRKTGNMCQVWILNENINPVAAVTTGDDEAICGQCPHRKQSDGSRSCYVNVGQAPLSVWRAFKADKYKLLWTNEELEQAVSGRKIRWGAYGDPAMLPVKLVNWLNSCADGWTGYTHQWLKDYAQGFKRTFMASVDDSFEDAQASYHGWSRFFVIPKDAKLSDIYSFSGSIQSPKPKACSNAINSEISCLNCSLCDGNHGSIYINAHGPGAKHVSLNITSPLSKN